MDLLNRLNYKDQKEIFVINAPESFSEALAEFRKALLVINSEGIDRPVEFVLAFVSSEKEIQKYAALLLPKVKENGLVWFAYPKKSSKKYHSDISRDQGWDALGTYGFEPVRQVAIDDDWSALRFRPLKEIKKFTRVPEGALSPEGREVARESHPMPKD